jgi:hypothetical protein
MNKDKPVVNKDLVDYLEYLHSILHEIAVYITDIKSDDHEMLRKVVLHSDTIAKNLNEMVDILDIINPKDERFNDAHITDCFIRKKKIYNLTKDDENFNI